MAVTRYFLGGNTASGFVSFYGQFCRGPEEFLWVIKGGPGCGKSSFMKTIGKAAEDAGLDTEYVLCSGDPDSVDGVYLPALHTGYADGTAPHVLEAVTPGAAGLYLDLGQFYDRIALQKERRAIELLQTRYRALYREAYARLAAFARPSCPLPAQEERKNTLPLGISFYTFQAASYVIDIYRRKYEIANGLLDFATYLCMFPQLIAGPIVSFSEVKDDLHKQRKISLPKIEWGTTIFVLGLAYKVLLANKIASLWNTVMTAGVMGIHPLTAWLGSWGFSMQLFFDFFGYSLMAIGLGRILGFKFPTNFKNPYCATSSTDFWRRWHITLSRWFREYVYIPLGGNRKGQKRMILNTFIVWLLTGLWHGADWNFIIWGMFFFVLLTVEKLFLLDKLERHAILSHIYMLIVIPVSWTIFNISDLPTLGNYIKRLFFLPVKGSVKIDTFPKFLELFGTYWWLLAICAICCTPIPIRLLKRFYKTWVCKILMLALFWLSVYQIASGANNPFLYFRF